MNQLIEKLKVRWGVKKLWEVVLILVIFSVTGITTLYVKTFVFGILNITSETPFLLKVLIWIVVVIPSYQLLFLFYGYILGQFDFVWRFEKNSLEKIKKLFSNPTDG